MADDGLYDDIEDISSREEPVAVSSAPLKDDESGVYVTTTDESQAPAGNDAAPVVEKAATNTAQNALTALYVGNLHWWITDVQLQTMCEEYGKLRTPPRFFEDRVNGKSKGYAIVDFTEADAASAAMAGLQGRQLDGKGLLVNFASAGVPAALASTPAAAAGASTGGASAPAAASAAGNGGGGGGGGRGFNQAAAQHQAQQLALRASVGMGGNGMMGSGMMGMGGGMMRPGMGMGMGNGMMGMGMGMGMGMMAGMGGGCMAGGMGMGMRGPMINGMMGMGGGCMGGMGGSMPGSISGGRGGGGGGKRSCSGGDGGGGSKQPRMAATEDNPEIEGDAWS